MIPRITPSWHTPEWQNELAGAINTPEALFQRLNLPEHLLAQAKKAHALFPLRVPEAYLRRIVVGDIADPLLRQVLPLGAELKTHAGYTVDPVGDNLARQQPGLLHKYKGRALLLTTPACAIHCRYCFRREFDYQRNRPLGRQWEETLSYLESDNSIYEVILSGGDPLSLHDTKLDSMLEDLSKIKHLRYLRIHSRLPVVIPSRVTEKLLDLLGSTPLKPVVVLHINHPNELDEATLRAIGLLHEAGVQLLNQTVLLSGVNDNAKTLIALSHALGSANILPYYLHVLDKVQGAAHFSISDDEAMQIYRNMQAELSGYLVPRLVRETPGAPGKTLL